MNKQTGFTLIELIMVIVILGILAATALPKFVNLSSDARIASVQALEGSMRSANSIIYATAAVNNQAGTTGTVNVGGVNVPVAYGFAKQASGVGIADVMDVGTAYTGTTMQLYLAQAPTPTSCGVTYTAATLATSSVSGAPTYTQVTTGC